MITTPLQKKKNATPLADGVGVPRRHTQFVQNKKQKKTEEKKTQHLWQMELVYHVAVRSSCHGARYLETCAQEDPVYTRLASL